MRKGVERATPHRDIVLTLPHLGKSHVVALRHEHAVPLEAAIATGRRCDATADLPLELMYAPSIAVADPCPGDDTHLIALSEQLANAIRPECIPEDLRETAWKSVHSVEKQSSLLYEDLVAQPMESFESLVSDKQCGVSGLELSQRQLHGNDLHAGMREDGCRFLDFEPVTGKKSKPHAHRPSLQGVYNMSSPPVYLRAMYVDLHLHLRGTITAVTARRLAARNGISLPEYLLAVPGYSWTDFSSFLRVYDRIASLVATATDLEEVAYDHLSSVAAEGTGYVEFMLSTPHEGRGGVTYEDQMAAIDAAADRALEETGIECRIIATAVRHLGPDAATTAARTAARGGSHRLVGFGLTGDERQYETALFREAFAIARAEGLRTTAHAGEHLGAGTIIEAIEVLGLDRVGHGVRAVASPEVMQTLAGLGTPLEICIASNVALGVCPDVGEHPVAALAEAGCAITLGTDDPAYFATSPAREYQLAGQILPSLTVERISRTAIRAAFCDEDTKASLLSRLEAWARAQAAGTSATP